jgi:hypothetical protein
VFVGQFQEIEGVLVFHRELRLSSYMARVAPYRS